jgi:hypothetical protein
VGNGEMDFPFMNYGPRILRGIQKEFEKDSKKFESNLRSGGKRIFPNGFPIYAKMI